MKFLTTCFFALSTTLFGFQSPIGVKTLDFFDQVRNRKVLVEVWYPIDEGKEPSLEEDQDAYWKKVWVYPQEVREAPISEKQEQYPLILMSHGNSGLRLDRSWFAEEMVKKGYIVASVEHFGNTWDNDDPTFFFRPWERPIDVTFALDQILSEKELSDKIAHDQIGFCGYSLGGMTGLLLAGAKFEDFKTHLSSSKMKNMPARLLDKFLKEFDWEKSLSSYKDERIKAYLLLAPAASVFDSSSLALISAPMHIMYSEGDKTLPPESHAIYVGQKVSHAQITKVDQNASHYIFLNEVSDPGKKVLPAWIYEEHPMVNRERICNTVVEEAENFFIENLKS